MKTFTSFAALVLVAAIASSLVDEAMGQAVPTVTSPTSIPLPANRVSSGQIWTAAQWNVAFFNKKDTIIFTKLTSGSAAIQLTTDGSSATTTNTGAIPNSTTVQYSGQCVVLNQVSKAANTYSIGFSAISNIGGTVAVSGTNPAVVVGPVLSAGLALAAPITAVADNTNKGWNISYTPPVGNLSAMIATCTLELLVVQ